MLVFLVNWYSNHSRLATGVLLYNCERDLFFPKLILGHVYSEQWSRVLASCGRRVREWAVRTAEKNIRRQRCRNVVKLILRTAGVCSCVIWQIHTFGGTSFIFMAQCCSVISHRYAVWLPPYKWDWRIFTALRQRKIFEGGALNYRSLRTIQRRMTSWWQNSLSASRLVRGTD